ncbi:hypothetical protein N8T08_004849 [Aspergillus melleus]|uniref:Uncharacterized protein n=1 Tax=Aspergillus melleus TaxID=138277 RepID=A0ACC3B3G0_9EURO|nr:hypothetical protein N8T08_004849 [Aspergillus melleus]
MPSLSVTGGGDKPGIREMQLTPEHGLLTDLIMDTFLGVPLHVQCKKTQRVSVIGQRKVEHLSANKEALSISLSVADMDEIDGAIAFDVGSQ